MILFKARSENVARIVPSGANASHPVWLKPPTENDHADLYKWWFSEERRDVTDLPGQYERDALRELKEANRRKDSFWFERFRESQASLFKATGGKDGWNDHDPERTLGFRAIGTNVKQAAEILRLARRIKKLTAQLTIAKSTKVRATAKRTPKKRWASQFSN